MQELSERDETAITKAGKGGAVVKIDAEDYIREAESRLKSKDNCMIQSTPVKDLESNKW